MLTASLASCSTGKIPVEKETVALAWAEVFGGRGDRGIHLYLDAHFATQPTFLAVRPGKNPAVAMVPDAVPNRYTGGILNGIGGFSLEEARTTKQFFLLWTVNGQTDSLRISSVQQSSSIEHP